MISASLVLYHNKQSDIDKVIHSILSSKIDCLCIVDHSSNDSFKVLSDLSDRIHYIHTPLTLIIAPHSGRDAKRNCARPLVRSPPWRISLWATRKIFSCVWGSKGRRQAERIFLPKLKVSSP